MLNDDFITLTIAKQKSIALIAHDSKKAEMIDWCRQNREILSHHFLCGAGTTARMVTDATDLPVKGYNSGPLGGDQQIGAKIVEGRIDLVIFLSDPLTAAQNSRRWTDPVLLREFFCPNGYRPSGRAWPGRIPASCPRTVTATLRSRHSFGVRSRHSGSSSA